MKQKAILASHGSPTPLGTKMKINKIKSDTLGELQFIKFCTVNEISIKKITEKSKRTADFILSKNSINVIAEVKDVEKNNTTDICWEKAGKVVRHKIDSSYQQIKNECENLYPGILVIYTNQPSFVSSITAEDVSAAMFGFHQIVLASNYKNKIIRKIGEKFGPGRRTTSNHCKSLSAIITLEQTRNNDFINTVYHNPFAKIPLCLNFFKGQGMYQYIADKEKIKQELFSSWIAI